METLKLVIVGHVDHGKSTLIGRLLYDTGSLPPDRIREMKRIARGLGRDAEFAHLLDQLEEERQQGITIDTTQVFFRSRSREYVIIDAPGHVEFVKNMITGASRAEAAVLIIDVNEGVKEQTLRHAYILSLLGITQVIVIVNKMDAVGYDENRFNAAKEETEKFFGALGMETTVYIPISALKGENVAKKTGKMPWYKGPTFLQSLGTFTSQEPPKKKPFVMPVQDVYKIGDKRITVGRIEAGAVKQFDTIKILPHNQTTKIATIERYPGEISAAYTTWSIGVTTQDDVFLNRGDIICEENGEPHFVDSFWASIFWLSKKSFSAHERLTIRCATQETTCTIERIKRRIDSSTFEVIEENADSLGNLETGEVIIKTKKPIAVKAFRDIQELGRFVLVREGNTCAGGIVTKIA